MATALARHTLFVFALLYCMESARGGHHSSHPEQTEQDTMTYYYDPDSRYFIAATHSTCYMVKISQAESDHVHTNQGVEDLELKMIHDWLGKLSETKIFHNDQNLPHNIAHWCSKHDIFLLNRVVPVDPTHSSPLSPRP